VMIRYEEYATWRDSPWDYQDDPKLQEDERRALVGNYRLLDRGRVLECIRGEVLSAARNGLCTLCGRSDVSTIDHFLPKESYPEYSIMVENLLAACPRCNLKKNDSIGTPGQRYLYPSAELLATVRLLTCNVTVDSGVPFFDFEGNLELEPELRACVEFHLETLDLHDAYSMGALNELQERLDLFVESFEFGGRSRLLYELERSHSSIVSKFGSSYWKVAVYAGLMECEEFLNDPVTSTAELTY